MQREFPRAKKEVSLSAGTRLPDAQDTFVIFSDASQKGLGYVF